MNGFDDTPDRRFWTAYDHFKVEQEARAMRRAQINAMVKRAWQNASARLRAALAHAGAQPPKHSRTRTA